MIITDFLKQKLANSLGGWKNATATHYNIRVYRAKCRVIDTISDTELAKADFKEIGGIVDNTAPVQQAQQLTLDEIV